MLTCLVVVSGINNKGRHEDGETGIHHTTLLQLITESSLSLARTHGKYKAPRCAAPRGCVVRCCPGAETEGRKREGGGLPRHRRGHVEMRGVEVNLDYIIVSFSFNRHKFYENRLLGSCVPISVEQV